MRNKRLRRAAKERGVLVCGRFERLIRRAIAQRLEGSRFGAYAATLAHFVSTLIRPRRVRTGGSRERPMAMQ
jgi:hypothetical protein